MEFATAAQKGNQRNAGKRAPTRRGLPLWRQLPKEIAPNFELWLVQDLVPLKKLNGEGKMTVQRIKNSKTDALSTFRFSTRDFKCIEENIRVIIKVSL